MEFEKRWQQEQLRIKTEQAMFNEQVSTVQLVSMMTLADEIYFVSRL